MQQEDGLQPGLVLSGGPKYRPWLLHFSSLHLQPCFHLPSTHQFGFLQCLVEMICHPSSVLAWIRIQKPTHWTLSTISGISWHCHQRKAPWWMPSYRMNPSLFVPIHTARTVSHFLSSLASNHWQSLKTKYSTSKYVEDLFSSIPSGASSCDF